MPRALILAIACLLWLMAPAAADAQRCVAPPGTGAVDQYCEVVPTAKGDRDAGGPSVAPISEATADALQRSGADGQALAQVLGREPEATGGKRGRGDGVGDNGGSGARGVPAVALPDTPNPFSAVTQSVGGGSTVGTGFVLAVLIAVLLMAAWGWFAYRRRTP